MKETYYFPHDFEPTSDPKIQALIGEYGAPGYGIYWRIVEMLHSDQNHKLPFKQYVFLAIAKQMLANAEQIQAIIQHCINPCELLRSDNEFFWSERVLRNIKQRMQLSEKRAIAGRAGAIAKQKLAKPSKGKERKGNKNININIPFEDFWQLYEKKEGHKSKCEKLWKNLSDNERQEIIKTLPGFKAQINDKRFQPFPCTYLNQRRWEDEPDPTTSIGQHVIPGGTKIASI